MLDFCKIVGGGGQEGRRELKEHYYKWLQWWTMGPKQGKRGNEYIRQEKVEKQQVNGLDI